MSFHAFNHIRYADIDAADIADGRNDAQGQAVFVGVNEAAAEVAARRVASHHPGCAVIAGQAETFVDDVFTEFDDFFDADSNVFLFQFLFHADLLCQQGVDAIGQDDDISVKFFAACHDADDFAVFDDEFIDEEAFRQHNAGFFSFISQPFIEFGTQYRIGRIFEVFQFIRTILEAQCTAFSHERQAFLRNLTFNRSFCCEIRNQFFQAVSIETAAAGVFGTAELTALHHHNIQTSSGHCQGCSRTS